jgi:hypothetical protein
MSTDTTASVCLNIRLAYSSLATLLTTKVHEARLGISVFCRHEFNVQSVVRRHINGGRNKSRIGAASQNTPNTMRQSARLKDRAFVLYLLEAPKSSAEKGNML